MAKIEEIEGIGPALAERLHGAGVTSIEQLLEQGASAAGRKALALKSGIEESRLLRWVNHADLMRVKGIGSEYSELLEAAGVDSAPELAGRVAANLHAKLGEVNAAKSLVRRVPTLSEVEGWIADAKTLPKVVTH